MTFQGPAPDAQIDSLRPANPSDPLTLGERAVSWLTAGVVHLALGIVLGLLAARLMRRGHLHWTWAAGAFGCVLALRTALSEFAIMLSAATLTAAAAGRRWHREDVDAGADLAEVAARRLRPLDVLASVAQRARQRVRPRTRDRCADGQRLALGCDERGRAVCVPFACSTQGAHTLIVGATGSGKTVTQTLMVGRGIERGAGAIVIDPKGDRALRDAIVRAAQCAGRRFIAWSPEGPSVYNPYARGSETEIADKVLASERFTEPHYQRQAQRYLGHVVRVLRSAGAEVCLPRIVDCLDPARLECLARSQPEDQARTTYAYLDSLTARQRLDLAGVRDRLAILSESDVGAWLDPTGGGAFDLLSAARSRAIVYFDLRADSRPLLAQMLGGAVVQDLQTTIAALQATPTPTLAVIDEFSALAVEHVVRLFARARSAGVSLLLGTQELSDLRLRGRESALEPVLGNLSVLIAHRQVVPDSAQLIAGLAGTRGAWRTSRHAGGALSRTRAREAVLAPSEITGLGTGWAAVIALSEGCAARITRIQSPAAGR